MMKKITANFKVWRGMCPLSKLIDNSYVLAVANNIIPRLKSPTHTYNKACLEQQESLAVVVHSKFEACFFPF